MEEGKNRKGLKTRKMTVGRKEMDRWRMENMDLGLEEERGMGKVVRLELEKRPDERKER